MTSPGPHPNPDVPMRADTGRRGLLPPAPAAPLVLTLIGAVVDWSIVVIGAVMIVLVFFNVVSHLFGKDMAATTELCELLMVWVTFLGGAAAARRGAHMTITELLDKLKAPARRWADLVIAGISAAMLCLLTWYGWIITASAWTNRLTVLDIPMSFEYLALPVASLLTLIFVLWDALQILQGRSCEQRFGTES